MSKILHLEMKNVQDAVEVVQARDDEIQHQINDFTGSIQKRQSEFETEFGNTLVASKLETKLAITRSEEVGIANGKMLDHLQTELHDFMDSSGKHTSVLRHDHQGIKEGISMLDAAKKGLKSNLKKFGEEYGSYVDEMDKWSSTVNTKITDILNAMEPTKMDWRIDAVSKKVRGKMIFFR